ncbi:2'-deoxycytidine 5'-triphosphate deaminase [candidate division WOR-3 bacterium]|nr:2'-deoxycytidine 5'-triphosphate deaminase [candidate division WOR-3 bacterium]
MSDELDLLRPGVLPRYLLLQLAERGILKGVSEKEKKDIDASSIDLHISDECYRMDAAIKPKGKEPYSEVVASKCRDCILPQNEAFELRKGEVYIFKLKEEVDFSNYPQFHGQSTGRSSIGRLDVLARVISSGADCYDNIQSCYDGPLFVEVVPISFSVKIPEGFAICQLRVFCGDPELSRIEGDELAIYKDLLCDDKGKMYPIEKGKKPRLNLNLDPDENLGFAAFRAKDTDALLDLTLGNSVLDPDPFWEKAPVKDKMLLVKQGHFYIMRSRQRLCLPGDVAVYCQAVTEELGELRIHYAGFAHPWFGRERPGGGMGTPLILEVRGHTFDMYLRDGEALATLEFYKMSEPLKKRDKKRVNKNQYTGQGLKLSTYFKDWK